MQTTRASRQTHPEPFSITLRQGTKRVRKNRQCSNRHPVKAGEPVAYWIGRIEGQFAPYEECAECVRLGWGLPWLAPYWEADA